jgi:thiaminase/transcriptional activator TenA
MFSRHAVGIVSAELELHNSLFAQFGIDQDAAAKTPESPTNAAYTSYLLATTFSGSYGEGLGAVLPCYWIYAEVGRHLLAQGSANPRYQQWIDTYGAPEFGAEAREVIVATDKFSAAASGSDRDRLRHHFRMTSRYEWMFFDMGYACERWPL